MSVFQLEKDVERVRFVLEKRGLDHAVRAIERINDTRGPPDRVLGIRPAQDELRTCPRARQRGAQIVGERSGDLLPHSVLDERVGGARLHDRLVE